MNRPDNTKDVKENFFDALDKYLTRLRDGPHDGDEEELIFDDFFEEVLVIFIDFVNYVREKRVSLTTEVRAIPTLASLPQPAPVGNGEVVLPMVLLDIQERAEAGLRKYGTRLRTFNGRDALWDAYQEAIDLVMYLRQAIEERNYVRETDD